MNLQRLLEAELPRQANSFQKSLAISDGSHFKPAFAEIETSLRVEAIRLKLAIGQVARQTD